MRGLHRAAHVVRVPFPRFSSALSANAPAGIESPSTPFVRDPTLKAGS